MTAYSTTFTRPSNVANTPTAAGAIMSCDKLCEGGVEVSWGTSAKTTDAQREHVTRERVRRDTFMRPSLRAHFRATGCSRSSKRGDHYRITTLNVGVTETWGQGGEGYTP